MKYGVMVGEGSGAKPELGGLVERARLAEASGLDSAWVANISIDAILASAVAGRVTERIEIGSAVTPIPIRHPAAMQQAAETAQQACDGRFVLGVGMAHKFLVKGGWGLSYDRPAAQMRAYLEALAPVLSGEAVTCENEFFNVKLQPNPLAPRTEVLVAALGPIMLELAGELAAGTITWATGSRTLAEHIVPTINKTHSSPRVVAGFPVSITNNVEAGKAKAARLFAGYARIPSYRAMLEREGIAGVEELAMIGSEKEVAQRITKLESIGVTDFCGFPFETEPGEVDRTIRFLGSMA